MNIRDLKTIVAWIQNNMIESNKSIILAQLNNLLEEWEQQNKELDRMAQHMRSTPWVYLPPHRSWEYKDKVWARERPGDIRKDIAQLGTEGWRLVSMIKDGTGIWAFFERPLTISNLAQNS